MKNLKTYDKPRIHKYSDFILEKVYLSNTIFKEYNLLVDPYSGVGTFNLELKGGYRDMQMEIQTYGSKTDNEFILRIPSKLSPLPEKDGIFKTIIKDILFILNKNKLGLNFSLVKVDKERQLDLYAIVKSNENISIEDLERISQTTKIVNSKIIDTDDFDKLIYKTNESNLFDDLKNSYQNILIQIKELTDKHRDLLYTNGKNDYPNKPIGGSNPYYQCKYCGQSDPNVDIDGHFNSCEWESVYNRFDILKSQLPSEVQDNLGDYLDEL